MRLLPGPLNTEGLPVFTQPNPLLLGSHEIQDAGSRQGGQRFAVRRADHTVQFHARSERQNVYLLPQFSIEAVDFTLDSADK